MNEINVEKIMAEIREEIKQKGFDSKQLSFEKKTAEKKSGPVFDMKELDQALFDLNHNYEVAHDRPYTAGGIKKLFQKFAKKSTQFYTEPQLKDLNNVNGLETKTLNLMSYYIKEDKAYKDFKKDVLTRQVEGLMARVNQLEKQVASLKAELEAEKGD